MNDRKYVGGALDREENERKMMLRMAVYRDRLRKRVYLPKRDYTGTGYHRLADPTHAVLDFRPVLEVLSLGSRRASLRA